MSPPQVATGGTATVTLTARDAHDNQESSGGLNVAFKVSGIVGGTFGPVTDNENGTYAATFTAGTTTGNDTITATIDGKAVTSTPPTITVATTTAGIVAASSLGAATTNNLATDAALRALMLENSSVTAKPRPLFEP